MVWIPLFDRFLLDFVVVVCARFVGNIDLFLCIWVVCLALLFYRRILIFLIMLRITIVPGSFN